MIQLTTNHVCIGLVMKKQLAVTLTNVDPLHIEAWIMGCIMHVAWMEFICILIEMSLIFST